MTPGAVEVDMCPLAPPDTLLTRGAARALLGILKDAAIPSVTEPETTLFLGEDAPSS